jgi:hypothetical protein
VCMRVSLHTRARVFGSVTRRSLACACVRVFLQSAKAAALSGAARLEAIQVGRVALPSLLAAHARRSLVPRRGWSALNANSS